MKGFFATMALLAALMFVGVALSTPSEEVEAEEDDAETVEIDLEIVDLDLTTNGYVDLVTEVTNPHDFSVEGIECVIHLLDERGNRLGGWTDSTSFEVNGGHLILPGRTKQVTFELGRPGGVPTGGEYLCTGTVWEEDEN